LIISGSAVFGAFLGMILLAKDAGHRVGDTVIPDILIAISEPDQELIGSRILSAGLSGGAITGVMVAVFTLFYFKNMLAVVFFPCVWGMGGFLSGILINLLCYRSKSKMLGIIVGGIIGCLIHMLLVMGMVNSLYAPDYIIEIASAMGLGFISVGITGLASVVWLKREVGEF